MQQDIAIAAVYSLTMNTRDAAYLTAHHYPGGVHTLAARMGMDARDLSRKLNPNTGRCGLDDAIALMTMTGDHRILFAIASELGYTLTAQPSQEA